MKILLSILVYAALTLFSYKGFSDFYLAQKIDKVDKTAWVTKKIFMLKEVQFQQRHLRKIKGPQAHLSILTISEPTLKDPYYNFKLGYNSEIRFETYNNYKINIKDINKRDIEKYLYILNLEGSFIPLSQWRRLNKN